MRRYIVTRTDSTVLVFDLALKLLNDGHIADWGFANPWEVENGVRWWIEVKDGI